MCWPYMARKLKKILNLVFIFVFLMDILTSTLRDCFLNDCTSRLMVNKGKIWGKLTWIYVEEY